MWCLKRQEGLCVYILPNQKKSFGKQSDIKLEGDATISRLHTTISVESTGESDTQYKCFIKDVSKYGTFVIRSDKKMKLPTHEKFLLEAGDTVQFGLKETTFIVFHHSFVTARSSLNEEEVNRLKNILEHIGGRLSETWENSCTHLTVAKSILFTTKLACALAAAKPIITIAYWEAVNIAIKESKELPEIEGFLPLVKEDWMKVCPKLFLPNEKRRTLFKGLSFVHFCAKQYYAYVPLITAAGGKSCVYPTKRPLTPRDLTAKNAIVIQQPVSDSTQFTQVIVADYQIIYHKLQALKRRMISDTEIPLAILYCTMESYCNPKFDFTTLLKSKTQTFSPSDIMIIEDTQNIGKPDNREIKRKIIPETCNSQINESSLQLMLKKVRFSNKNEQRSDSSESNIIVKDTPDGKKKEINREIIPESCDSQNDKNISKKVYFSNESEQSNSNSKSDSSNSDIVNKIFSRKINKQPEIIPESCCSSEKNESSNFSNNNQQDQITSETCNFNKRHVTNNLATEKRQQNVILQEKEAFEKNNLILTKNNQQKNTLRENQSDFQQRENILINEENDFIFEENNANKKNNTIPLKNNPQRKNSLQDDECEYQQPKTISINEKNRMTSKRNNLSCEESNAIIEKDKVNNDNDRYGSTSGENSKSSKNLKKPKIVSIQETNNCEIRIQQEKDMLEKNCTRVKKPQNLLKERQLGAVFNSKENREDKRVTENKIQEKDKRNVEPRKKVNNWYDKYSREFTNEILRKDVPCGKRFTKASVTIPKKIWREDDLIL